MQTINISYSFSDSSHKNSCYELTVTNIHDNQSNPNGSGEQGGSGKPTGKQGLDWSGIGNSVSGSNPGTIALSVQVRAERAGTNMNARDYDITVECAQFQCGNPSNLIAGPDQGDLHVIVPHDQGH
jgi:hypothetical protein